MNEQVKAYLGKYSAELVRLFEDLGQMIFDAAGADIREDLWARIPSYYAGEAFVRLIPFKDHINVEAAAVLQHKDDLQGYKITPKGMLQIYLWAAYSKGFADGNFQRNAELKWRREGLIYEKDGNED